MATATWIKTQRIWHITCPGKDKELKLYDEREVIRTYHNATAFKLCVPGSQNITAAHEQIRKHIGNFRLWKIVYKPHSYTHCSGFE